MVRKCCVPECSSNYDAALKKGSAATSTFKFPDDAAAHGQWVKAIRRPNWVPSKRASVCINHFKPDDIVKYDKPAKLKPGAVPCLFGDSLTQEVVVPKRGRPRKCKGPVATGKAPLHLEESNQTKKHLNTVSYAGHVIEDCILNFENFKAYIRDKLQNTQWMVFPKSDVVHLFILDDADDQYPLRIENSIKVYTDLKIKLYKKDEEQTDAKLRWILGVDNKLLRWSQIMTIVNKYGDAARQEKPLEGNEHADETLKKELVETLVLEEHLDNTELYDVDKHDLVNTEAGKTIKLEIEQQLNFALDEHFVDIGTADSVESDDSFAGSEVMRSNDIGGSKEPYIAKRKPISSLVRELQSTKYKCFVCNTDQETQDQYEQHVPAHLSMLPYHCPRCVKEKVTIKTLASLNKHFLMHLKPLKCRFCDVRFTTYASRILHEQGKHATGAAFRCDVCQREFSSRRNYRYHRKVHDDPEALKCTICARTLSSTYEVKMHMRTHTGEKPNKCSFCAISFNRRSNLTEHIRRYHSMERPFACAFCGERFRTNAGLKKHIGSHDFNTAQEMEKPKRVSGSTKVLQCQDCDRKFASPVSYHSHRRQHDKRYQCSYCGIRIAQLRDFEDHENIHTGARPYECKTCGKTFRTASTYYGHVLVHGREKKHFCTICNKGFLRFYHVQVHMRTHTGEKPFRCDVCGRRYADKTAYQRHQLTHRPTVADMLRAKEIVRSTNSAVQECLLPLIGNETNEAFTSSVGEQVGHQMDLVFSSATLHPASDDGIGVLPSITSRGLGGECPVVFEYLSEDAYMTELPQIITSDNICEFTTHHC